MKAAIEKSQKWLKEQPNVIFAGESRGLGMTGIMLSVHKSYPDLDKFLRHHRQQMGDLLDNVETIIVNLKGKAGYRPLHLKYLAETDR